MATKLYKIYNIYFKISVHHIKTEIAVIFHTHFHTKGLTSILSKVDNNFGSTTFFQYDFADIHF